MATLDRPTLAKRRLARSQARRAQHGDFGNDTEPAFCILCETDVGDAPAKGCQHYVCEPCATYTNVLQAGLDTVAEWYEKKAAGDGSRGSSYGPACVCPEGCEDSIETLIPSEAPFEIIRTHMNYRRMCRRIRTRYAASPEKALFDQLPSKQGPLPEFTSRGKFYAMSDSNTLYAVKPADFFNQPLETVLLRVIDAESEVTSRVLYVWTSKKQQILDVIKVVEAMRYPIPESSVKGDLYSMYFSIRKNGKELKLAQFCPVEDFLEHNDTVMKIREF
ncbi:hypothetical protein H2198_008195 [Neophaeococcomyces mojaviensis]|uniref:Uncharacterized protein n=1 Tax=Neophaeococcomyces mojaviensis TaxID=3383035 RepID=A0ACC2ZY09_9EURO|nr:hypothetical protein H2198_008195 [Knufia sp. JES_112]